LQVLLEEARFISSVSVDKILAVERPQKATPVKVGGPATAPILSLAVHTKREKAPFAVRMEDLGG
jgi:hypothetical protein